MKIFDGPYYIYPDKEEDKLNKPSKHNLSAAEAKKYNEQNYAVAVYVNDLAGGRANKDCVAIRAWFVDIDYKGNKLPLDDLLDFSPLIPSAVVETCHGYHLYWATSTASVDNRWIDQQRAIVEHFGGDPKCINFARGLRCPGFYHHKHDQPYLVSVAFSADVEYTPAQIDFAFPQPEVEDQEEQPAVVRSYKELPADNSFNRIFNYDAEEMLKILCSAGVIPKRYTFKHNSNGNVNIIVDGKDSGCFINKDKKVIGSPEYRGGAVEWLAYYGYGRVEAAKKICEVMGWEYKL